MVKYSEDFLIGIYKVMLKIRLCEESLIDPILRGEVVCPCHLCSGQEAIAAGVCAALNERDYIFGNHRSHGHYIAKGGGLKELIAEIYCKETGCAKGRGGSMHITAPEFGVLGTSPLVGGTISLATGAALASRLRDDKRVTVSFFGDGATGEGVLHEAMNIAALKRLPIIYACENNFYSTHMTIAECRATSNIYKNGTLFCITSWRVDGNDVLKVYETAKRASEMCRSNNGPVLIEFITYRLRGHVGPDDNIQGTHTDIRPQSEIDGWRRKDPIKRLESYLLKNKVLSSEVMNKMKDDTLAEVAEAHEYARSSPHPDVRDLEKYVFKA